MILPSGYCRSWIDTLTVIQPQTATVKSKDKPLNYLNSRVERHMSIDSIDMMIHTECRTAPVF